MLLKKLTVYHYFWITAVIILIIGFCRPDTTANSLDINIHDTYIVVPNSSASIIIAFCYFLLGSGYWLVQKVLKRKLLPYLTLIHCVILFGCFLVYWIVYFYTSIITKNPFPLFDDYQLINQTLLLEFLLLLFIGQPVYLANLLISLFRKGYVNH